MSIIKIANLAAFYPYFCMGGTSIVKLRGKVTKLLLICQKKSEKNKNIFYNNDEKTFISLIVRLFIKMFYFFK